MVLPSADLVRRARAQGWGVGAFNAVNMESMQAIFGAAEQERSPFILQITQTTLDYTHPEELYAMAQAIAERTAVPFAIHLDHGRTFEAAMRFIRLGATSVMIDGSLQADGKTPRSYQENVAVTRQVVQAAHAVAVSVEAELGLLGQITASETGFLTDPQEACRFVEETGVDLLAVSIGTAHGLYRGTPQLAHDRLREIAAAVPIPLVMHGGTGVPDDDVRQAVQEGIAKINIDTQIRVAFFGALAEQVHRAEQGFAEADGKGEVRKYDIRKLLAPTREAMQQAIAERMRVFGSAGQA